MLLFEWLKTEHDVAQHQLVGTTLCIIIFMYVITNREHMRHIKDVFTMLQRWWFNKKEDIVTRFKYFCEECQEEYRLRKEQAGRKTVVDELREKLLEIVDELFDEVLFKQPESSYLGDCPICFLPMPLDPDKSIISLCCSKSICDGCNYASWAKRDTKLKQKSSCPFCREPTPDTEEGFDKQLMKRVEANDPVAICYEGGKQYYKGEYSKAVEYYIKAAELGDVEAHFRLAVMYQDGEGVEKDSGKKIHHMEIGAIRGHPAARCFLGHEEWNNRNYERAVKHWIIAAKQGEEDDSVKYLMFAFKHGKISKVDLTATLRAHQTAVDETKSPMREEAEEYRRRKKEREQKRG